MIPRKKIVSAPSSLAVTKKREGDHSSLDLLMSPAQKSGVSQARTYAFAYGLGEARVVGGSPGVLDTELILPR